MRPVVPRERSEGFTRLPHCRVRVHLSAIPDGLAHPSRFAPAAREYDDMANPCLMPVHLPGDSRMP